MRDKQGLCCPLSHELFDDPVVAADGITYERSWVEKRFFNSPHESPMTGLPIKTKVGGTWGCLASLCKACKALFELSVG